MKPVNILPARRRTGFTLVEVLISVALVLILILGINEVFRLTSRAVGAGQALSDINRTARDAQSVFFSDLSHADVTNGPFIVIKGGTSVAFRNREDQLNDRDFIVSDTNITNADNNTRSIDLTRSGTETIIPRPFMNRRNHRTDMLRFFTRTIARRQTGDNASFTSGVSSSEQYITYGHLYQPANDGSLLAGHQFGVRGGGSATYESPTTNPNNFYATDWVLGRNVFVMVDSDPAVPSSSSTPRYVYDWSTGTAVRVMYYTRDSGTSASASAGPFTLNSQATSDGMSFSGADNIQWSTYDVAGVSMSHYAADLNTFVNTAAANKNTWWDTNHIDFRFSGYPIPARPLSRASVARTVPCFVQHCTQFVVEYAGDFVSQDPNTGSVNAVADGAGHGTDGQIDFYIDPVTKKRSIQWYGFPRDTSGNGIIRASDGDVVPLRDVATVPLPFERVLPTATKLGDYGVETALTASSVYTCAWGPDTASYPKPKMLRITMAIDDPASRLPEEQSFEYVVTLP